MKDHILSAFLQTEKKLLEVFSSLTAEQVNSIPFEGSWTAGQVMQHINLSASSADVLRGPVKKSNRAPDEHVDGLRSIFMDFSTRMNAPDFIVPEDKVYNAEELVATFHAIAEQWKQIIETTDLSEICLNTPPVLGELTRLELAWFINFHILRHTHQLENIKRMLDAG